MKGRTLFLLRRFHWLALAGVVLSGCSDVPPLATAPTPPATPSVPATISLTAVSGIGATAGRIYLAATVRDTAGKAVPAAAVHFTTTTGAIQPDTVIADSGGLAQTTVTTSSAATIIATAGSASGRIDVLPSPTQIAPTPQPPSPPPGSPSPPAAGPLTVTILFTPGLAGAPTTFSLATQALAQAVWNFGDGGSVTTASGATTHVYATEGTFTVGVTVTDTLGRTASATQAVAIAAQTAGSAPPPTDPGTLVLSMGCTVAAAGSPTVCNLSATYGGNPVSSQNFLEIDVDFGDGHFDQFLNTPLIQRTYTQPGTYLMVVTVKKIRTIDNRELSGTISQSVVVAGAAPPSP